MAINLGNSQSNITTPGLNQNLAQQAEEVDQLSQLQQFAWQVGTGPWNYFPVTNVQTNISQDLAVHKYPDLDAARVENTGRNPIEVSCTAIFVNTITPGAKESWNAGTLYPNIYQNVLNSALLRQTGTLQHPFIGQFTAKLVSAHSTMSADMRGGELLELHFIETINDNSILNSIQSASPDANGAAASLDTTLQSLTAAQLAQLNTYGFNPDVMAAILAAQSLAATTSIIFTSLTNAILNGNVPLPTQTMLLAVGIAQSSLLISACQQTNDVDYADVNNAAWVYLATMETFQANLNSESQTLSTYVTQQPLSLNTIATILDTDLLDLMSYNPALLAYPVVPAFSQVLYVQ